MKVEVLRDHCRKTNFFILDSDKIKSKSITEAQMPEIEFLAIRIQTREISLNIHPELSNSVLHFGIKEIKVLLELYPTINPELP